MLRMAAVVASLALGLGCNPPRVLVLGLDGATWQVIDPLVEAGHLRTLGSLIASGARYDLDCAPAYRAAACFCPPVWTSIATGRVAAEHHIQAVATPSYDRPVKALWNVLHEYSGRRTLIAYRGTWPPEDEADLVLTEPGVAVAAGELYATFPAPTHPGASMSLTHAKPPGVLEDLGLLPSPVPEDERRATWLAFGEDRVSMRALLRIAAQQAQEPSWSRVPDLTMVLLHGIDRSEHMAWGSIQDAQWGPIDQDALVGQAVAYAGPVFNGPPFGWSDVAAQYMEADAWLAELLEVIDYDYVILVSDHGMTRRVYGAGLPGTHDPEHPEAHLGILSITGPGIVEGQDLGRATVLDVAPTIAHLLGLPVGEDLPGRVLSEAFAGNYLEYLPVNWVPSWE